MFFSYPGDDNLAFTSAKRYIASLWYKGEIPLLDCNTLCGIPVIGNHIYTPLSPLVFLVNFPGIPEGVGHTFAVILLYCFGAAFICLYITRILQCNLSLGFALGIIYIVSEPSQQFARGLGQYGTAVFIPAILYFMDQQNKTPLWHNNIIIAVLLAVSFYFGSVDFFLVNCFLVACGLGYRMVKSGSYLLYSSRLAVIFLLTAALGAAVIFPTLETIIRAFPRTISLLRSNSASNPLLWVLDSLSPSVMWAYNEWFLYDFFHKLLGFTAKPYFNGFRVLGPLSLFGLIYALISPDEKIKFSRDFYLAVIGFFFVFIWLLYDTGLPEKYMIAKRFPYLRDAKLMLLPLYLFMTARLFQDIIAGGLSGKNSVILKKVTVVSALLSVCFFLFITLAISNLLPEFLQKLPAIEMYSKIRVNYYHIVVGFGLVFCCYFLFYKLLANNNLSLYKKEIVSIVLICICLLPTVFYSHIANAYKFFTNITGNSHIGDLISIGENAYDADIAMTPAESFVKKILDPTKERADYDIIRTENYLRQLLFDIPTAGGYAAFYNTRVREFYRKIYAYGIGGDRDLMITVAHPESPAIDILSVKYLITDKEDLSWFKKWEKVFEDKLTSKRHRFVYRNNNALDRFFTVPSVKIFAEKDSLFAAINSGLYLQAGAPILESDLDANALAFLKKLKAPESDPAGDDIRVSSYKSASITLETITSAPGILIITNSWDSGWSCKINGNTSPIYPFYYALQGILLPPGQNSIELTYAPKSFRISVIITLLAFAGVGLYFILRRKESCPPNPPPHLEVG